MHGRAYRDLSTEALIKKLAEAQDDEFLGFLDYEGLSPGKVLTPLKELYRLYKAYTAVPMSYLDFQEEAEKHFNIETRCIGLNRRLRNVTIKRRKPKLNKVRAVQRMVKALGLTDGPHWIRVRLFCDKKDAIVSSLFRILFKTKLTREGLVARLNLTEQEVISAKEAYEKTRKISSIRSKSKSKNKMGADNGLRLSEEAEPNREKVAE